MVRTRIFGSADEYSSKSVSFDIPIAISMVFYAIPNWSLVSLPNAEKLLHLIHETVATIEMRKRLCAKWLQNMICFVSLIKVSCWNDCC